jgi:hypothetical protein
VSIRPVTSRLLGLDETGLVSVEGHLMHGDIVGDWLQLKNAATDAGFDLAVASSYRSFERQLIIWNEKAQGLRPVFDRQGNLIDLSSLDPKSQVHAILQWSALPGGSRHHWGTDLDIYDRSAVDDEYQVQLSAQEVEKGGVFCALHDYLDQQLYPAGNNNFFRPYTGLGGVACERWHISHCSLSRALCPLMTKELLTNTIATQAGTDFMLQDAVLSQLDEIFQQYVQPYLELA